MAGLGDLGNFSTRPVDFREGRKVFPDRGGHVMSSYAIDDLRFAPHSHFQNDAVAQRQK